MGADDTKRDVPIEPTAEMLQAGILAVSGFGRRLGAPEMTNEEKVRAVWSAMLDAAPRP